MDVTTTWRGWLLGYWDHKMWSKNPSDRICVVMRCGFRRLAGFCWRWTWVTQISLWWVKLHAKSLNVCWHLRKNPRSFEMELTFLLKHHFWGPILNPVSICAFFCIDDAQLISKPSNSRFITWFALRQVPFEEVPEKFTDEGALESSVMTLSGILFSNISRQQSQSGDDS